MAPAAAETRALWWPAIATATAVALLFVVLMYGENRFARLEAENRFARLETENRFARLEARLEALSDRNGALQAQLTATQERNAVLTTKLEEKLETLTAQDAKHDTQTEALIIALTAQDAKHDTQIEAQTKTFNLLGSETAEKLGAIGWQVGSLSNKVESCALQQGDTVAPVVNLTTVLSDNMREDLNLHAAAQQREINAMRTELDAISKAITGANFTAINSSLLTMNRSLVSITQRLESTIVGTDRRLQEASENQADCQIKEIAVDAHNLAMTVSNAFHDLVGGEDGLLDGGDFTRVHVKLPQIVSSGVTSYGRRECVRSLCENTYILNRGWICLPFGEAEVVDCLDEKTTAQAFPTWLSNPPCCRKATMNTTTCQNCTGTFASVLRSLSSTPMITCL